MASTRQARCADGTSWSGNPEGPATWEGTSGWTALSRSMRRAPDMAELAGSVLAPPSGLRVPEQEGTAEPSACATWVPRSHESCPHHGHHYADHSKHRLKWIRAGRAWQGQRARGVCVSPRGTRVLLRPTEPRAAPQPATSPAAKDATAQGVWGCAYGHGSHWPCHRPRGPAHQPPGARAPLRALYVVAFLQQDDDRGQGAKRHRPDGVTPQEPRKGSVPPSLGLWNLQAAGS